MRIVFVLPGVTCLFDHSCQFSRMSFSTTMLINTNNFRTTKGTKGNIGAKELVEGVGGKEVSVVGIEL